jgi:acetyl/propionyl-CoA carboxylase alpha subunit
MVVKKKIRKILIANRGEIAFRISKTIRKMKLQAVGVSIQDERQAGFLSKCNEVHLFEKNELSSYLNIEEIIRIAKACKADAIHPGYGFLSENPSFAQACEDNGIVFLGPNPSTIRLMGDKNEAKIFAKQCGIPVLETVVESKEFDSTFEKNIRTMQLPLILKPLNGGGGKGMTVVRAWDHIDADLKQARNIAKNAFGDARLLAEPFIEKALHLEVQIIGDSMGEVRHLYERDCTIQRRHQKIVEETPSPLIKPEQLEKMYANAVELGEKSHYQSLGTVEFIVDPSRGYFFMEMNTRLQVEHPVTEITLGLDLVEKQIQIANGQSLTKILPKKIKPKGHAIEVRIYTENPSENFMPSTGKVEYLKLPKESKSVRLDCGIEQGTKIHHSFDPMIMKITVHGATREKAITALLDALQETIIFGIHTNINYLQWILQHSDFVENRHDTRWSEKTLAEFQKITTDDTGLNLILRSFEKEKMRRQSDWKNDPWLTLNMNQSIQWKNEMFWIGDMGRKFEKSGMISQKRNVSPEAKTLQGAVLETSNGYWLSIHGNTFFYPKIEISFDDSDIETSKVVKAPMTGTVLQVHVQEGTVVKKKDLLIEMEAMKMQYKIEAPQDGTVAKVFCQTKDIVEHESVLVELQ